MSKIQLSVLVLLLWLPGAVNTVLAGEHKSRYATLTYTNNEVLREFNDNMRLNKKLNYSMRKNNVVTMADEVLAKADIIIEKVQVVLDMFPGKYHVRLVVVGDSGDVARIYKQKYGKRVSHIAYYSLSEKTIYISAEDASLRVLAHEVGHSIVDHYFKVRPPYNIHELMAQFAEKHVTD
ncbi:hypothetical protein UWK_01788 [Desulfocapsa sulfexigens DSM 10523]|uniref:Uncharacterized protein n=1 Tax=Desulfocapsa sulfexigens (strain DSM 10523 / SB164P1) TaxID=1167006 RepID=M1PPK1_DESSD|nr:hypothetical protein [Desulfocapsa sulfexigens]AGF78346.1 hypothetical protein UWK_01788 [Desulfocapsa sulfexigens DSM 10523]